MTTSAGGPQRLRSTEPLIVRLLNTVTAWPDSAKYALGYLGASVVLALISIGGFVMKPSKVECDGETMFPGAVCRQYREPGHRYIGSKSYSEMLDDVRNSNVMVGRIALALLVITLVVGTVHVTKALRAERAAARR